MSYLVLCFILGLVLHFRNLIFSQIVHFKIVQLDFGKGLFRFDSLYIFDFILIRRQSLQALLLIIESFGAKYLKYNTSFRFVYCLVQICLGQSAFSSFHSWSVSRTNNWQYSFCASTISHQRLQTIGDLLIIGAASDD